MVTTIQIDEDLKEKLDELKIHHRETYNDLIERLVQCTPQNMSEENLVATIEILSDSETMVNIKDALKRIEEGDYGIPLEDVRKELGL